MGVADTKWFNGSHALKLCQPNIESLIRVHKKIGMVDFLVVDNRITCMQMMMLLEVRR